MSKINNIKIKYSATFGFIVLLILAIFTFGTALMPVKASAQYFYSNNRPDANSLEPDFANIEENEKTVAIIGNGFDENSVARWNGSTRATTFIGPTHLLIHLNAADLQGASQGYINVFNPADGSYSNALPFTIKGYVETGLDNNAKEIDSASTLASNAIFGSDGVLPSGLIQWILFAIVILLIVILARKISGGAERYHNEPLKHA